MNEFTYSETDVLKGKAFRDTYAGCVFVTLIDGRRVVAFTRKTVAHARALMARAINEPALRGRIVSVIAKREGMRHE